MKATYSIITVTKDDLPGLVDTAKSLQLQTSPNYEWIVIDGASSDGTAEFLEGTAAIWISETDSGLYDAMNKGIERARGDYMIFMNAGDVFADADILELLDEQIQSTPDFLYGDALEIDSKNNIHYKRARPYIKREWGMFTHHQAMIYRRDKVAELRYNTSYKIAADYDFTLKVLKRCERVMYCPFPICIFEPGGISQQQTKTGRSEQYAIRKNYTGGIKNAVIMTAQIFMQVFRNWMPGLYWRIKSR